jgi:uncharacterized protein YndB with AHSA1/START domain
MSVDPSEYATSVTRRIEAPAEEIFAVLCDPAAHVAIDGSGMLRAAEAELVTKVGDSFVVEMWNPNMDDYQITNTIVAFDQDRQIRWHPLLTRASRPEAQDRVGVSVGHVWGFELTPIGERVTDVTETVDYSASPEWLQELSQGGRTWIDALTATLEKLAARF